jgi:hypothetical protein
MPGGELLITKETVKSPEDRMLEIIRSMPHIDAHKLWAEVEAERAREHR